MKKYDGWTVKNKWGSFLFYFFEITRKGVIGKIGIERWEAWEKEGHKIVKVKLVEVK